jgi:hypothetical protein
MDGSSDVSNPLNITKPGVSDHFSLIRKKRLLKFGYSTDMYLASKDEYLYTKITSIAPLYVIVNSTQYTILLA